MSGRNRLIYLIIFNLFIEVLLILFSSIHWSFLLISLVISLGILFQENKEKDLFVSIYFSSLIHIFIHYILFTLSYAEILPWETILLIFLIIFIIYYNQRLAIRTKKSFLNCFPFGKKSEDFDCSTNLLIIKSFVIHICFYLYTLHLCLTTICTPQMYFNWFLLIQNCRYIYIYLHSSYTFSGGILLSSSWLFLSIYSLIQYLVR